MYKQMAYHAIEEGSGLPLGNELTPWCQGEGQNSFGTTRALLSWHKRMSVSAGH
jgi:hypothetical protein